MVPERFKFEAQISATPHAQVWKTFDIERGRSVVLKNAPQDARLLKRFQREIDALQQAQGHHVIPLLDYDETFSWYTMPLAEHTLFDHKIVNGLTEGMAVLRAVAEALRPIHFRKQVHRDLKPQNILWLSEGGYGRWVVADFGIIRNRHGETTNQLTREGTLLGTQGWAPPELYDTAHDVSPATDVFSVGAILAWMLTGKLPTPTHVPLPEAPPAVRGILMRATQSAAPHRYSSIDDLLKEFSQISSSDAAQLSTLIKALDFSAIGTYILGDAARVPEGAVEFPSFARRDIQKWRKNDSGGLLSTVGFMLQELREDIRGMAYSDIDRFLIWCVDVLEDLLRAINLQDAEHFATLLFSTIADINQFAPAKDLLDLLDTLANTDQEIMKSALYSSTGLEFFRGQASGRFVTNRTSEFVRELSES